MIRSCPSLYRSARRAGGLILCSLLRVAHGRETGLRSAEGVADACRAHDSWDRFRVEESKALRKANKYSRASWGLIHHRPSFKGVAKRSGESSNKWAKSSYAEHVEMTQCPAAVHITLKISTSSQRGPRPCQECGCTLRLSRVLIRKACLQHNETFRVS